jgi:hypothetical protein
MTALGSQCEKASSTVGAFQRVGTLDKLDRDGGDGSWVDASEPTSGITV